MPPRPEVRPASPHELDARTLGILEALDAGGLDEEDRFFIDPLIIPDDTTYEWKRATTLGKEDPSYTVNLRRMGWETVPSARHPELMPTGHSGPIERDGCVLMERHSLITEKVRERDYRRARAQVRDNEVQLGQAPNGAPPRDNKGNTLAKVRTTYEPPIKVPE